MKYAVVSALLIAGISGVALAQLNPDVARQARGRLEPGVLAPPSPATLDEPAFLPGTGEISILSRSPLADKSALSSFQLRFTESDHKINAIAVWLDRDSRTLLRFRDRDANDTFGGRASWYQSSSFTAKQMLVAPAVGGRIVELPEAPPGKVPLLTGFSFALVNGTDSNIQRITLQIMPDNRHVRVGLHDERGIDYLANVQYVFVPQASILQMRSVSGTSSMASGGDLPARGEKVALRGFRFEFGNSSHFLQKFGVNLNPDSTMPQVEFQDSNTDDPIAWVVDYAVLR